MSKVPAHVVDRWRRTLAEHHRVNGVCPRCRVPYRCRPWADAFGELVAHGYTPLQTTGGPAAGATKEGEPWPSPGSGRHDATTPAPTASR